MYNVNNLKLHLKLKFTWNGSGFRIANPFLNPYMQCISCEFIGQVLTSSILHVSPPHLDTHYPISSLATTWHLQYHIHTKVGDSIKKVHVYCNVVVKLSGNIMVHALLGNVFICDILVKFFSDFITV